MKGLSREARDLAAKVAALGFSIECKNGRYQVKDKTTNRHTIFAFSVAPRDRNAVKNAQANLRRLGVLPRKP